MHCHSPITTAHIVDRQWQQGDTVTDKMAESDKKRVVVLAIDGSKQAEHMVECKWSFINALYIL